MRPHVKNGNYIIASVRLRWRRKTMLMSLSRLTEFICVRHSPNSSTCLCGLLHFISCLLLRVWIKLSCRRRRRRRWWPRQRHRVLWHANDAREQHRNSSDRKSICRFTCTLILILMRFWLISFASMMKDAQHEYSACCCTSHFVHCLLKPINEFCVTQVEEKKRAEMRDGNGIAVSNSVSLLQRQHGSHRQHDENT